MTEDNLYNPTVFAILQAVDDRRPDDASMLIDALVEESGSARSAVLDTVIVAILLHHSSPAMPLSLISAMTQTELDDGGILAGDLADEFMTVVEQLLTSGPVLDEASLELLRRWDLRPGSSEAVAMLARAMSAVIAQLRLQLMIPLSRMRNDGEVDEIVAQAFTKMRAEIDKNRPPIAE